MKTFIEVETLQAGQPRAYADSETVFTVKLEHIVLYGPDKGQRKPMTHWDKDVKAFAQTPYAKLGGGWVDEGDPAMNWASTKLVSIQLVEPGMFRVHTRTAFTD